MEQRKGFSSSYNNYQVNPYSGHIRSSFPVENKDEKIFNNHLKLGDRSKVKRSTFNKKQTKAVDMQVYKEKKVNKINGIDGKNRVRKRKLKLHLKPLIIATVLVAMSFIAVYQNSQLQTWGYSVSEAREKLVKIQNQNESLHQMRAELTNLDRIERIAKGELNMTLPQKTILYEPKYEANFKSN